MNTILDKLLEEHKSFLLLMSDVAGHSISENAWIKVRSYLSPTNKFRLIEPIMMTPEILSNTIITINKHIEFTVRGQIKLYLLYTFPDYEDAACNEFLINGASLQMPYSISEPYIEHCVAKSPDDPNKVTGIISISRNSCIDGTYDIVAACFPHTAKNK